MTTDPRYTDAAHALAVAMHDANCHDRTCNATTIASTYGGLAITALDHLAERGLLLPEGTKSRTEHGYRYRITEGYAWTPVALMSPEEADRTVAEARAGYGDAAEFQHVTRTVHETPWQPPQPAGDDG